MGIRQVFHHLTYTDRVKIEALRARGDSPREIAAYIGFSVSTVYRELKRGAYERMDTYLRKIPAYSADIGQKDYDYKSTNKGACLKIGKDFELVEFIETKILTENYSPDAVMGLILKKRLVFKTRICTKTVYNYIHNQVFLRLTNKDLPRGGKVKRDYQKVHEARIKNPLCRSIEDRPRYIERREEFGHWEMDTVVGKAKGGGQVLLVLTERMTRREIIMKLRGKTMAEVVRALDKLERKYPARFPELFKSITVDNGSEFSDAQGMEHSCLSDKRRTVVYYCHPYSSWERGSNENINAMIRRFIPKSAPIEDYTENQINIIQNWINNYPRRVLHYQSSNDVFTEYLRGIG